MDRFTTKESSKAELLGCIYCLEHSNCYSNMSCDEIYNALSKLRYYENMEEQGRLVILPCKIGDTVYFRTYEKNATVDLGIQPHEISTYRLGMVVEDRFGTPTTVLPEYEFGRSVFLTREEAEATLNDD